MCYKMRTLTKLGEAMTDRFSGRPGEDGASVPEAGPEAVGDIQEIAACLGITVERVLREVAAIAFSRITDFVEWNDKGLHYTAPSDLSDADRAAIIEVVAPAKGGAPYRIRLHDKRGALDLLARCLGMLAKKPNANDDGPTAEEARERLLLALDSIAAETEAEESAADRPQ